MKNLATVDAIAADVAGSVRRGQGQSAAAQGHLRRWPVLAGALLV